MPKAKSHPGQLGFAFEAPSAAIENGSLADLDRELSGVVGTILASDERSRREIAAKMSDLLDDEISHLMLDAYASRAREDHRIPATRLFALIAVTKRHDLLDPIMRRIGASLLVGDEVRTARIGHLSQKMKEIQDEMKQLKDSAPLIRGDS